jgi:hypothetical protein
MEKLITPHARGIAEELLAISQGESGRRTMKTA